MKTHYAAGLLLTLSFLLSGCENLPVPDFFYDAGNAPDTVERKLPDGKDAPNITRTQIKLDSLITHIECELLRSPNLDVLLTDPAYSQFRDYSKSLLNDPAIPGNVDATEPYVMEVTLTLRVDDNAGLTPSLSFLYPLKNSASLTVGMNGNANVARQRIFNTSYWISLSSLVTDPTVARRCGDPKHMLGPRDADKLPKDVVAAPAKDDPVPDLLGDLGFDGIIAGGLAARGDMRTGAGRSSNYVAPVAPGGAKGASPTPCVNVNIVLNHNAPPSPPFTFPCIPAQTPPSSPPLPVPDAARLPTFGSTVQFVILATFDVGPTWSIANFKGPGGSKGIFNGGQTNTDSIVVAFAPVTKSAKTPKKAAAERELAAAQNSYVEFIGKLKPLQPLSLTEEKEVQHQFDELRIAHDNAANAANADEEGQAAAAAQAFTTNSILQNLTGSLQH